MYKNKMIKDYHNFFQETKNNMIFMNNISEYWQ